MSEAVRDARPLTGPCFTVRAGVLYFFDMRASHSWGDSPRSMDVARMTRMLPGVTFTVEGRGSYRLHYVDEDSAILLHMGGEHNWKQAFRKIFIPPERNVFVSGGQWRVW